MRAELQTFMAQAGEASCYALSIMDIAEDITGKGLDIIATLIDAIRLGYIHYNWGNPYGDPNNFFVDKPGEFLSWLTGQKWDISHDAANYVPAPGEYIINRWEYTSHSTGQDIVHGHFRRPNKDSIFGSNCVKFGKVVSTRVCRRKGA